jgi:hypothetical protein
MTTTTYSPVDDDNSSKNADAASNKSTKDDSWQTSTVLPRVNKYVNEKE